MFLSHCTSSTQSLSLLESILVKPEAPPPPPDACSTILIYVIPVMLTLHPKKVPKHFFYLYVFFFFHPIRGVPCIPLFVWFLKGLSCLSEICGRKGWGGGDRCCMIFNICKNVLSAWPRVAVLLNIETTEHGIISELGAIFKMTCSLFLFSPLVLLFAGGYILMCLQKNFTFFPPWLLCARNRSLFIKCHFLKISNGFSLILFNTGMQFIMTHPILTFLPFLL